MGRIAKETVQVYEKMFVGTIKKQGNSGAYINMLQRLIGKKVKIILI